MLLNSTTNPPNSEFDMPIKDGGCSLSTLQHGNACSMSGHAPQAKKRVFEIQQARLAGNKSKRKRELREDLAMATRSNEAVEVLPHLEPLPKWVLVQNILEVTIFLYQMQMERSFCWPPLLVMCGGRA